MLKVIAKIKTTDEKSLNRIKEAIKEMASHIPVKIGDYWVYGIVPVEFEEIENEKKHD